MELDRTLKMTKILTLFESIERDENGIDQRFGLIFSQFSRICYASFSNFVKTIFSGLYMNLDDLQPIIVDFEPNEGYNMI